MPLLLKLIPLLLKAKEGIRKNPFIGICGVLLLALLFSTYSLVQTEKELDRVKASKPNTKKQIQTVTVRGPKEVVERVVYRNGPDKTVERIREVKVASEDIYTGIWESREFDHNLLSNNKRVYSLGYSYHAFASPMHSLSLGREIFSVFVLSGGLGYIPARRDIGYNLGIAFKF